MLSLRPARHSECTTLTDLCLRSKAAWGYDATFMQRCHSELTITPERLDRSIGQVAEDDGRLVGFAEIVVDGEVACLEKLFIDPKELRTGVGRKLFDWARRRASEQGASVMLIESDPQAAAFYRRMGAVDVGAVASGAIPGRVIPKLRILL